MSNLILTSVILDGKSHSFSSFNKARKFARKNKIGVVTQVVQNFMDTERNFHPMISRDYVV